MKMKYFILALLSQSLFAQDYLTIKEFYEKLGPAQNYIEMNPLKDEQDPLLMNVSKNKSDNQKYLLDSDTFFSTNTDKIISQSSASNLIEARKQLFQTFPYNDKEGNFLFPHPILTHWDIIPHPPIQKLDHGNEYYTDTYLEKNIGINQEMLSYGFNSKLDEITNSQLTFNNQVSMFHNKEVIIELMKLLKNTKESVLASNMFLSCDSTLEPLLSLMQDKINEGVEIHLILERVFALKYSKCFKRVKKMGVKVRYSNKMIKLKNRFVYHNKFWIFDQEKALVYGANLLDNEVESTGFNNMFRDSGARVIGPIVNQLTSEYLKIHKYLKGDKTPLLEKIDRDTLARIKTDLIQKNIGSEQLQNNQKTDGMCRIVFQGPNTKNPTSVTNMYQFIAENSKHSLYLTTVRLPTQYDFANDKYTSQLLKTIFEKSIQNPNFQVDIMTNNWRGATDVKSINYKDTGFFSYLYKLFAHGEPNVINLNGVRKYLGGDKRPSNFNVWNYFNYYHGKQMLADNTLNVIGSFNMNKTSNERSFEMALVCHDQNSIKSAQRGIISDLINSVPLVE